MFHHEGNSDEKDILEEKHWKNMIDPLDVGLRRMIIHYGELLQATYDAFIFDPASKFVGKCHFRPDNILQKCHVSSASMYEVTKYIYATSTTIDFPISSMINSVFDGGFSRETNWMGYIAVATDAGKSTLGRRDIVVTWRGTKRPLEWINNFKFAPLPASHFLGHQHGGGEYGLFPHGWMSIYTTENHWPPFKKTTSARNQVLEEVKRLVELYKDEEVTITITGHSLGAALGTINALDIVANGVNIPVSRPKTHFSVTAFVFGSPRIGDPKFCKIFNKMPHLKLLQVRNEPDTVPNVPPGYEHVGVELTIDTRKSEYLKSPGEVSSYHNLEVYLHGVAGTQGENNHEFKLVVDRDIALVNKSSGALKEDHHVPESWWVISNKGMVKGEDGRWRLMDCEMDHDQ